MSLSSVEVAKKAAAARHDKPASEISAIALRAAATRKRENPDAFKNMGSAGAKVRHGIGKEREREIAIRAAATRKLKNPDAFREMGRIGAIARKRTLLITKGEGNA